MNSYAYKLLNFSSDAIRVLRLFSNSDFDSGIQCELIETRLGDIPYEAVSYTWGSMDKPCKITLNGFECYVMEHLYTALQYLRLLNRSRCLWVDAICINQDNVEERGHQVGQMRLVYEKAKGVLIWLGISDPGIDKLFMTINPPKRVGWIGIGPCSYGFRADLQVIVSKVMARPWFRRVWIIQEVASSTVATVVCGHHSVSTRKFKPILDLDENVVPRHCQEILSIMPGPPRLYSWWAWEGKRGPSHCRSSSPPARQLMSATRFMHYFVYHLIPVTAKFSFPITGRIPSKLFTILGLISCSIRSWIPHYTGSHISV